MADCTALKDRVPRAFFSHLHEISDFAHGMPNLCEPFYLLHNPDDDYFADLKDGRDVQKKKALEKSEELRAVGEAVHVNTTDAAENDNNTCNNTVLWI